MIKSKSRLEKGDNVAFHSGNFEGLTGKITKLEYGEQFEPYGLRFTVELSNGKIGYIEKAEHWHFI